MFLSLGVIVPKLIYFGTILAAGSLVTYNDVKYKVKKGSFVYSSLPVTHYVNGNKGEGYLAKGQRVWLNYAEGSICPYVCLESSSNNGKNIISPIPRDGVTSDFKPNGFYGGKKNKLCYKYREIKDCTIETLSQFEKITDCSKIYGEKVSSYCGF